MYTDSIDTEFKLFLFSSTLGVAQPFPFHTGINGNTMLAQGQTTPLNHDSQKGLLREQQGKWLANLHPINTSTAVQGAAFPSECLGIYVHILRVAWSSSPQILHPFTPGTKMGTKNLGKRIMTMVLFH